LGVREAVVATVKKGVLTPPGKWWKHLRRIKRLFWKRERTAAKELIRRESK